MLLLYFYTALQLNGSFQNDIEPAMDGFYFFNRSFHDRQNHIFVPHLV